MNLSSLAQAGDGHPDFIWRNGALVPWPEATVHVNAVGHASVPAVFEGIKAYWNAEREQLHVFRLREHLKRFLDSIRLVRLQTGFSLDALVDATLDLLRANQTREDTYIRPWCFVAGVQREIMVPADVPAEIVIDQWPFRSRMLTERGCSVGFSSWRRIGDNTMPPRIKAFANYHNGRLALMEARRNGYDWPLLLNSRDLVTEGPGACVALVRDGRVITPHTASGILESITRETVLGLCAEELHVPVVEREVERTELYVADEMFYMGTGWEILPIGSVDGLPVGDGKMGPVTRAIDRCYHDVVRGADPRHEEWRTPAW